MNVNQAQNAQTALPTSENIAANGGADLSNMFLQLLVAQISHQNPLDPLDGTQYVSQLAEFSNVESLQSIKQSMTDNVSYLDSLMVLEATSLVGTNVNVKSDTLALEQAGDIKGQVNLPVEAEKVLVQLYDRDGNLVEEQEMAYSGVGSLSFAFKDQNAGAYQVRAHAVINGTPRSLDTWLEGQVERISVGSSAEDILLQVNGLGNFALADINQMAARA